MWVFISIFVLIFYTLIVIYNGINILGLLRFFFPFFRSYAFWPLFILLCYSMIFIFLSRSERFSSLRNMALYPIPAMFYMALFLVIFNFLLFLLRQFGNISIIPGFYAAKTGIALIFTIIIMFYGYFHAKDIKTVHYSVNLDGYSNGGSLRIVLISDTHIGGMTDRRWLGRIVDTVNASEPDIIFITGDIFDRNPGTMPDRENKIAELRRLSARLGVYAVAGNHDVDRFTFGEEPETVTINEFLESAGIVFLQDEVRLINNSFYLIGRRDIRPIGGSVIRKSASELAAGLDNSFPIIFLDHQPMEFREMEEAGADLILSGHTHRGQFFPGNIATYFLFKRAGAVHYGHWRGERAQGIVSSGAGVWGLVFRLGSGSEAVVIDLQL